MKEPEEKLLPAEYRLLADTVLFSGVSRPVLDWALREEGCESAAYAKGEMIFSPGSYQRALGIVLSGAVEVSKRSGQGEALVVGVLDPGDLFGAASLFNEFPDYVTTITALSRCRVLFLSQRLMEALLKRDKNLSRNYIRYLSGRIHFLNDKLDGVLAGGAEQRLALFLLGAAEDVSTLPFPVSDLAKRLHMGRASLYRAFESLQLGGMIEKEGKTVRILDRRRLKALVQPER